MGITSFGRVAQVSLTYEICKSFDDGLKRLDEKRFVRYM